MNRIEDFVNNYPYHIILGSASPRRQELLKSLGYKFVTDPIAADESSWPASLKAQEICIYLAELKARSYSKPLKEKDLLITADTIVWCEGKVYNKPVDFEDGKKMLKELGGKMHEVFTAVCLKSAFRQDTFYDGSKVYFKEFSEAEIEYYLDKYKPYDKAGAYGVQEWLGYIGIEKIDGSFYNVMGLPVKKLYEELVSFAKDS
jgi:septum formation protein